MGNACRMKLSCTPEKRAPKKHEPIMRPKPPDILYLYRGLGKLNGQNQHLKGRDVQMIKPGEDQPAARQISSIEIPLDQAQEEAITLVKWANGTL